MRHDIHNLLLRQITYVYVLALADCEHSLCVQWFADVCVCGAPPVVIAINFNFRINQLSSVFFRCAFCYFP